MTLVKPKSSGNWGEKYSMQRLFIYKKRGKTTCFITLVVRSLKNYNKVKAHLPPRRNQRLWIWLDYHHLPPDSSFFIGRWIWVFTAGMNFSSPPPFPLLPFLFLPLFFSPPSSSCFHSSLFSLSLLLHSKSGVHNWCLFAWFVCFPNARSPIRNLSW